MVTIPTTRGLLSKTARYGRPWSSMIFLVRLICGAAVWRFYHDTTDKGYFARMTAGDRSLFRRGGPSKLGRKRNTRCKSFSSLSTPVPVLTFPRCPPQTDFKSAEDAIKLSLEHEARVTSQTNAIVSMARAHFIADFNVPSKTDRGTDN